MRWYEEVEVRFEEDDGVEIRVPHLKIQVQLEEGEELFSWLIVLFIK